MKNRLIFIAAALDSVELIDAYVDGYTQEQFLSDRKTQDAVIRNLEIIGQALKDYGVDSLIEQVPDIPWLQICGMRNILAHEYLGVDMVLIWETVKSQLSVLEDGLNQILRSD